MYDCTPDTFVTEPGTTAIYVDVWWRLAAGGKAKATAYTPEGAGYDTSLGGVDITVTHCDWNQHFNKTHSTITTT